MTEELPLNDGESPEPVPARTKSARELALAKQLSGLSADDPLVLLVERARLADLPLEFIGAANNGRLYLRLGLKSGREIWWKPFGSPAAQSILNADFENVSGLEGFEALHFKDAGTIECALSGEPQWMKAFGNAETLRRDIEGKAQWERFSFEKESATERDQPWRVPFAGRTPRGIEAEVGSPSPRYRALAWASYPTLRIHGVTTDRHDDARTLLETFAGSLLFDVDVIFGQHLGLRRRRPHRGREPGVGNQSLHASTPQISRLQYRLEPLRLYQHAREADAMPLLQFLAFYQVLEYFFSVHTRREALTRLRLELKDPTFQPDRDEHLSRILDVASQSSRGLVDEPTQLQATIRGSVSEGQIRHFLSAHPGLTDCISKKSRISGLPVVHVTSKDIDLVNSITKRVYELRCRVVHTKEEGNRSGQAPLLLPNSPELRDFHHEIDLVRFLAQKAIVQAGSSVDW